MTIEDIAEKYLHTHPVALGGYLLTVLTTLSAPQFVVAAHSLAGDFMTVQQVQVMDHILAFIGVTLAVNGKGIFSKTQP